LDALEIMKMQMFHRSGTPATEAEIAKSRPTNYPHTIYYTQQLPCGRCGGAGGGDQWRHTGWTCYQCGGHGRGRIIDVKLYTRARLDTLEAAQAKRDAKKARAAWLKGRRELKAWLRWVNETPEQKATVKRLLRASKLYPNTFLKDLAGKLRNHWELSPKQLAAADRVIASIEKQDAERGTSEWVGDIKERLELELLVLYTHAIDGYYGVSIITLMKDDQGNLFKWFNTSSTELNKGERVRIKGTVKGHDTYKGEKQTALTRCTLIEKFETITPERVADLEQIA
jgi:hypothetical protein